MLYTQCLELTLDTIATKEKLTDVEENPASQAAGFVQRNTPAQEVERPEMLVFKRLGKVGSQRAMMKHYKGKYQKEMVALELANKNAEMEQRPLWKNLDATGTSTEVALPALRAIKEIKTARLLNKMFGGAGSAGFGEDVLSDGEDEEEMALIEERARKSKNRFQMAGSSVLDQVFTSKLKSGVGVYLATVAAAASNKKKLQERQDNLDPQALTRRQRANAIMAGTFVGAKETSFSSNTSASAAAEAEKPVVKASWAKTEKYDAFGIAGTAGSRNFSKDPALPRYLSSAGGPEIESIESPSRKKRESSRERPLSPVKRSGEDWMNNAQPMRKTQPSTVAGGGAVGVYSLPGDKHVLNHDGVYENRARCARGEVNFCARGAAQETRPPALAGLRLLRPENSADSAPPDLLGRAADRAVRAVLHVHNGRSTASGISRSQLERQSAQTTMSSWREQERGRSPDKKARRAQRPTEQPTGVDLPFAVPGTLRTPPRKSMSRRATPSPSRRLSPLQSSPLHFQKTAPVVLAEFAQNESNLRAKTPWTGGGFRLPKDHDDLILMFGGKHAADGLNKTETRGFSSTSWDDVAIDGDLYESAGALHSQQSELLTPAQLREERVSESKAMELAAERAAAEREVGPLWPQLAGSEQPWGDGADNDAVLAAIGVGSALFPRAVQSSSSSLSAL